MNAFTHEQLDAFEQHFHVTLPISLRRYYTMDHPAQHFTSFSILDDEYEVDHILPLTGDELTVEKLAQWDREEDLLPQNSLIPVAEGSYGCFYYLDTVNESIYLHRRGEEEWTFVMTYFAEFVYQVESNQ